MGISTEIASAAKFIGEEKAVEYVAKAGFDAWDFSMFDMCKMDWHTGEILRTEHPLAGSHYLAFARRLKQIGLDNGIVCNQSHAPFPTGNPGVRDYLKRAIACTAEAGGRICVIHPDNNATPEKNAELYLELLPFAKSHGIKIAAENMWNWNQQTDTAAPAACSDPESFVAHLDAVNDDAFVACLDIGHAQMRGLHTTAPEMIEALGERLQALHIHDNDLHYDSHQIPFSMKIDFQAVVKALKKVGYQGEFTLEADAYLKQYRADDIFLGLEEMAQSARKLEKMFASA